MAAGQTQQDPYGSQQAPAPDFNKDYWAPDRAQVLKDKGIQDTSGKVWNGTTWADPSTAPAAAPSGPTYGSYTPTAGWDNTKLQDPNKHDPKYDWLRSVQAVGGNQDLQKAIDYYNTNFGQYNPKASLVQGSNDQVNFGGNYGNIDVLQDQEGARLNFWNPVDGGGGDAGGGATGGNSLAAMLGGGTGTGGLNLAGLQGLFGGSGAGVGGSAGGGTSSSFSGIPFSPQAGTFWDQLMGHSNQSLVPSKDDPIIRAQTDAYTALQRRADRNHMADLAEQAGPYANLGSEQRMMAEDEAQKGAQFQATLMQNELTARRQDIMQALQLQGQFLTEEQKSALQWQLGLIDAALRQQSITNQNNQFLDQMGYNYWDRSNYWDQQNAGY